MPSMPFHRFLIFLWASFSSHCETLNVNVEPLPQSMATIKKKVRTEQVLVNTCRNWNPCALWVGMNNNSASIRGCLKLKIGLLYIQQFPLWVYVQKNRKPDVSDTFVARVLITVVRGRGQLDCPHVDERINKMWPTYWDTGQPWQGSVSWHTLQHGWTWLMINELEGIMWNGTSQLQRAKYTVWFHGYVQKS